MRPRLSRCALLAACWLSACGGTDTTSGNFIPGTYNAALFLVTPSGQAQANVLAAGGSLSITISGSGQTTGSLNIPASVTGTTAFTASMEGTAVITGLTVQFQQAADTFVRDLVWSRVGPSLTVSDQSVGGASYTITLTRQ
jgi:hypothetical protein